MIDFGAHFEGKNVKKTRQKTTSTLTQISIKISIIFYRILIDFRSIFGPILKGKASKKRAKKQLSEIAKIALPCRRERDFCKNGSRINEQKPVQNRCKTLPKIDFKKNIVFFRFRRRKGRQKRPKNGRKRDKKAIRKKRRKKRRTMTPHCT